jgi:hypothetical protein
MNCLQGTFQNVWYGCSPYPGTDGEATSTEQRHAAASCELYATVYTKGTPRYIVTYAKGLHSLRERLPLTYNSVYRTLQRPLAHMARGMILCLDILRRASSHTSSASRTRHSTRSST